MNAILTPFYEDIRSAMIGNAIIGFMNLDFFTKINGAGLTARLEQSSKNISAELEPIYVGVCATLK